MGGKSRSAQPGEASGLTVTRQDPALLPEPEAQLAACRVTCRSHNGTPGCRAAHRAPSWGEAADPNARQRPGSQGGRPAKGPQVLPLTALPPRETASRLVVWEDHADLVITTALSKSC